MQGSSVYRCSRPACCWQRCKWVTFNWKLLYKPQPICRYALCVCLCVCVYTMSQPPPHHPPSPSSPLNPHVQRISRLANTSVKVFNISTVMTDLHAGQSADEHAIRFLLSEKVTSVSHTLHAGSWETTRFSGFRVCVLVNSSRHRRCKNRGVCVWEGEGDAWIVALRFGGADNCKMYYWLHMRHTCAMCVCVCAWCVMLWVEMYFVSTYAMKRMGVEPAESIVSTDFVHAAAVCVFVCVCMCVCVWALAVGVHMGEGGSSWAPGL